LAVYSLGEIANHNVWDLRLPESLNIATSLYIRIKPKVELWAGVETFELADTLKIEQVVKRYST